METNVLLEQYSRYKKIELQESPFHFLLDADIDPNPHQINAFCNAINALKTGGIILADEVGLGKTIEAGLVLDYVINSGRKKILIVLPATLRKQWEIELDEKFSIKTRILDRATVERERDQIKPWLEKSSALSVVLASYDYSSKLIKRFPHVKWDFIVIDEAHNLRNVFHGTKRAKRLYDLTKGVPKILLTATPLQNSLSDLHGLVSFIDPRIFGPEKVFEKRYVEGQNYSGLKAELRPVLYRTLRKDVARYMAFKKRTCITVDFHLSAEETRLYDLVNAFLKRDVLYSIPAENKGLIILVIRKLLASSSFALVETFEVFKKRLEKLYQGTRSAQAQDGFDLFWDFVEDEIEEAEIDDSDDEDLIIKKEQISDEIKAVEEIMDTALSVKTNAKISALKYALSIAFREQVKKNIPEKVVVFTESKRTQRYIAAELRKDGFSEEDILLFNGDFNDPMTSDIYRAWQVKNFGKTNYGRSVEYKHAIIDYFSSHAKVLIVTDTGSEGLNLQFCNTVINYDLPWNPQKIEQRIGRCHRYGQEHDVVAINLLNTDNEADKRVYEILSRKFELFDGVFGASDIALGALESGTGFEKRILDIYQKCDTDNQFKAEFDKLDKSLDVGLNKQANQLKNILLTESPEAKEESLDKTKKEISEYLHEVEYWKQFDEPIKDSNLNYWRIDNWGDSVFGCHGTLFIGAFCDNARILFPVLLLCDEDGNYIDFDESDIVSALEKADDMDIHVFKPSAEEKTGYSIIYNRLLNEMLVRYKRTVEPAEEYNRKKLENWVSIQKEQLYLQISEYNKEIEDLLYEEAYAHDPLQKQDIMKKVNEKKHQLDKLENGLKNKMSRIQKEADEEIEEFNKADRINPVLLINIVLKF